MEMELFTGDRRDFPQHVAPFPDSVDLTAVICSPEDPLMKSHRSNLPPQKLRPIRCNVRSPACSQPEDPIEYAEVVEFLHDQPCPVNGESTNYFFSPNPPVKAEAAEVGGGGNRPGTDGENRGPDFQEGVLEELSSSSSESDEENDSSASIKEPANLKRKRKARKIEVFLENLVMKVMERQEEMHKQLIEVIENREKERIEREEVWRRLEMERMKRDEEARIQDMSRNLALVSFIRNYLGNEIELPSSLPSTSVPSTVSSMEDNGGKNGSEDHIQGDIKSKSDPSSSWQEAKVQSSGGGNHVQKDVIKSDPNNKRWPEDEVQALIMLRNALDSKLRIAGSKCSIWDEISSGMQSMGYSRSAKKCKEKWENINKYFRKSMGSGKKRFENSKRCTYFQELSMLYSDGHLSDGNPLNHANNKN
ncbi:hypothetical protein SLE2022_368080 [Rubroshorea leprosula]